MTDSSDEKWQVIARRLVVDRSPWLRVYDEDVRLPDGMIITNFTRVEQPPFIMIFALREDGRVGLVRQYRQAVGDYILELPAGHIEDDEEPLAAAQRELREEVGLEARNWQFLSRFVMDVNRECGWGCAYLAQGAYQAAVEPLHGDLGDLTIHFLPLEEVHRIWAAGEFVSAATSLAIGLALNALRR